MPGGLLFCVRRLGAADILGARTLFRVLDLEGHGVIDLEIRVGDVDEGGGVEKHILILPFWGDETEPLVGQALDYSVHIDWNLFLNTLQFNASLRKLDKFTQHGVLRRLNTSLDHMV